MKDNALEESGDEVEVKPKTAKQKKKEFLRLKMSQIREHTDENHVSEVDENHVSEADSY